jgi:hypothetical protein
MKIFRLLAILPNRSATINVFCPFFFFLAITMIATLPSCKEEATVKSLKRMQIDPAQTKKMAAFVEGLIKPELDSNLTLQLWGIDSLVMSPISIDIDDQGRIYYATPTGKELGV